MDTVIVKNSQFYSHCQKRIAKGTVNAEHVEIRLDSEWDNLTVRIHWLNVASGVEKVVLLELDQPNTIPWEVLADLGELRMGLDGMDGGTIVKPTVWLTYGYVVDGVDPESGSDPQPPTPSWEQQMVEQARVAAEAAEEAKDAAVNAEKAASQAGPYADEAQKSAEAAKEAQRAASTSAQEAGDAKDQANTASNAAKVHADAAETAKAESERAAETAGNAQSEADQSAQSAANSAKKAEDAKLEAQKAAAVLPTPTPEDAGKILMVNPEGDGYIVGKAGGSDSGQNATLTTAQIEALHGMFKACAYDDSKDVSGAYAAFLSAFGITDSGDNEGGSGEDGGEETEKTLTSISATYSGGDVTVGTALTDLTGIVVTAHYSDGTSETVTDYTMNGTIAEGSNTVTVSYGGKTTTFTVNGAAVSEGETVEMVSVNQDVCTNLYTDNGTTTTKNYTGPSVASTKVFEQDTTVRIKFTGSGGYFCIKLGCFDEEAATAYYVFGSGDTVTPYETTYTVKAGYKLIIKTYSSAVLYDTLTVTKVVA